jgi:putative nucleotidyltransferase with HDIG domain
MALDPTLDEQELLADTFQRAGSRMTPRERVAEILVGTGFVAAVASLWAIEPPHGFAAVPAVVCVGVLALATMVRIDTPFGFTAPTQVAFVPLVFAMPLAIVPIAVVIALGIARLPEVFSAGLRPSRLLQTPGNAWFAIGPVAVFMLANVQPRHAGAALLLTALTAQFVIDFLVSALRFEISTGSSLSSQLRETWVYGIDAALSSVGLAIAEEVHTAPAATVAIVPLLGLLGVFARERHGRLESLLELNNAYRGTALVLGDVIETDDGYTGEHCKGVVGLALAVAEGLGLDAEQRRNLEFGALLHDIGKIAIPKEIVNKPGKLDPQEWTIIKTHTLEGQKMLDRVGGFMRGVGLIVRSHHERWDGSGYPDGLVGAEIPLEARIIACCDSWNAMRTDRSYRKALSHDVALAELRSNAGSQFDPQAVDALVEIVDPLAERDAARPRLLESRSWLRRAATSIAGLLAPGSI